MLPPPPKTGWTNYWLTKIGYQVTRNDHKSILEHRREMDSGEYASEERIVAAAGPAPVATPTATPTATLSAPALATKKKRPAPNSPVTINLSDNDNNKYELPTTRKASKTPRVGLVTSRQSGASQAPVSPAAPLQCCPDWLLTVGRLLWQGPGTPGK